MEDLPVKAGVLIVGSLMWDPGQWRERWRKQRLCVGQEVAVKVPIRYGRLSTGRKCYTMVVSQMLTEGENRLGSGIFVPVSHPIGGISDLILEARHMWGAEVNQEKLPKRFSAWKYKWGGIALGLNPSSSHLGGLKQGWEKAVAEKPDFYRDFEPATFEDSIVDFRGWLQMPWPTTLKGKPLEADLLLATVTQPTFLKGRGGYDRYADPYEIADAWNQLKEAEYFKKNRSNGIETFEDREISERLVV